MSTYSGTVAQLTSYGDCRNQKDWPDYPSQLGFTLVDVPELIRMALDPYFDDIESDQLEVWAPIHAMRALGQLRAEEAIAPLTELLSRDDDWFREELPDLFAMFGEPAIEPLIAFLKNETHDEWARVGAIDSLGAIALQHAACRQTCINVLVEHLQQYPQNGEIINSSLVFHLTELRAAETAPLIEEVFSTVELDEFLTGSWPMVQVRLGLKQASDFSPSELKPKFPPHLKELEGIMNLLGRHTNQPQGFGKTTPATPKKQKQKTKKKKK